MATTVNTSLIALYAGGGKWYTQNFPTCYRVWVKRLTVAGEVAAERWRLADDAEKTAWEAAPPTPPDVNDPGFKLFVTRFNLACVDWRTNKACGGFNAATGYFELNGILDITYEEALTIFELYEPNEHMMTRNYENSRIRTNIPNKWHELSSVDLVFRNSWIEIASTRGILSGSQFYKGCSRLRRVYAEHRRGGLDLSDSPKLEWIDFYFDGWADKDNDFRASPLLELGCLQAGIKQSSIQSSTRTVTVHPDVYAKLTDPDNTEWHAVLTAATEKNIIFATITT